MKKIIVPFCLLFSVTSYSQKKVYYTEDFKELSTAKGATLQYL
jgi:protein TonB